MQGKRSQNKGLKHHINVGKFSRIQQGFTLVELITIVVLISIVASLAIPSFNSIINNQAITAASTNVVAMLQTARTEAVKRSTVVKACFTEQAADFSTAEDCVDPGLTQHKISHLYTFIDAGTANVIDSGDTLISASAEFNSNLYFNQSSSKNMGKSIEFNQRGAAFFEAGEIRIAAYIAICDERSQEKSGRLITLNATGRTALSSIPENSQVACYDL